MNHNHQHSESIEDYNKTKQKLVFSKSPNPENKSEGFEEKEIKSWKIKLILAWVLTIPIALIMFSERIFGISLFGESSMTLILLIISFPVIFILGFQTIKSGIKGFTSLYFNMDSLIMLGTVIAYVTGILSFFISIQDYSGISAMIMVFFITGKYIETKAR